MISNYGIGGNEVKQDAHEAILDIPQNRTLIAQKLTGDTPLRPELVQGLQTIEEVFAHFKPAVKVSFEDPEGAVKTEDLRFSHLGDFGIKGITAQSRFLSNLATEKDQYQKIIRQLRTNKVLKSALADPEARQALLETIREIIAELHANK